MRLAADVTLAVLCSTRLFPLWCGGALGVLVMVVPALSGAELDFLDATLVLHLAMVTLLVGAAFTMDDPARPLAEVLPISVKATTAIRMGLVGLVVSGFWAVILWLAPYTVDSGVPYPRAGLVVEAYATLAWVWTIAVLVATRRGAGGVVAASFPLVLAAVMAMLPDSVALFVAPGAPTYPASRLRWAALLLTGLVALWCALAGLPRRRLVSR